MSKASEQMAQIPDEMLSEMVETLERVGCQFQFCGGPTLEPVAMVTCFVCDLLARLRVAAGRRGEAAAPPDQHHPS